MRDRSLFLSLGLAIGMGAACFNPETSDCTAGQAGCECAPDNTCEAGLECLDGLCSGDAETSGDGDGDTSGDGDGDSGDGDGDSGDGDGDGADNQAPVIDSFLINDSDAPPLVEQAGPIVIAVEASDDSSVAELRIEVDGQPYLTLPGPGPFLGEYVIGGEGFNGAYDFSVIAVDDEGLETSAGPISVGVSVTGGQLIETWTYDSGGSDRSCGIWVDRDGTELIITGDTEVGGQFQSRIDRLIGPDWSKQIDASSSSIMDIVRLQNGEYLAVGAAGEQTMLYRYDDEGVQIDTQAYDWTPPQVGPERWETPRQLHVDAEGSVYLLGDWDNQQPAPNPFYLVKFTPELEVEWQRWGDDANLAAESHAVKMDLNAEEIALAGLSGSAWMARFDTEGNFIEELTLMNHDLSNGRDVALDDDGGRLLVGYVRSDEDLYFRTLMQHSGSLNWEQVGTHDFSGYTLAAEYDDFGDSVVMSIEACAGSWRACSLFIRKFDVGGALLWEYQAPDNKFALSAPFEGDLATDRFGYVYATTLYESINGDWDRWAIKLHP